MPQIPPSVPEASEEQLIDQATAEAEVRLAELDDEEDPRPDQPPLKEGVHILDADKP